MDTELAVASKRDERRYSDRPIPDDVITRILDAGRVAGSSANRQARRFVVVESEEARRAVANAVYLPANVLGATLVIAVVGRSGFDVGRSAQNMMLVAWNEGVASCPNGIQDVEAAVRALALSEGVVPVNIPSFGYPRRPLEPESRSVEEWSAEANRKPLEEFITRR
jgi:nitroreductase